MMAAEALGHVVGGWEYVYASYLLTFGALGAYGLRLWLSRGRGAT
jgi:hypothetical protein